MLLTEEQARYKWCPEARVIMSNGAAELAAGNQDSEFNVLGACIGSGCMMWRWGEPADMADKDRGREGFCGLAGGWDTYE